MSIKQIFTVIILAVVAICMTACGFAPVKDNPAKNASIYGNGGMEIRKGDYIYFVNGFYGINEVTYSDTKYGNAVRGAIYRTKLVNGALQKNDDGELTDIDCIVPKVVGYEMNGFFIYDNKIFYASPNNEKNKNGELKKNKVDIFCCDIDGDNNKRLYTTSADYSSVQFNVFKFDISNKASSIFVNILDGDKLVTFEFRNGKNQGKTTIAGEGVTSIAWLKQTNYINDGVVNSGKISDKNKKIYYTVADEDTLTSKVMSYDLVGKKNEVLTNDNVNSYTLKALKNDKLYYEKSFSGLTNFVSNGLGENFVGGETTILYNAYKDYYVMDENDGAYAGGVIAVGENATYFVASGENGVDNKKTISSSTAYSLLFVNGSQLYVRNGNAQISIIDLTDKDYKVKDILSSEVKGKTDGNKYVDFDGRFITYYGESKTGDKTYYYTHLVDLTMENQDGTFQDDIVAKYAKNEKPDKVEDK